MRWGGAVGEGNQAEQAEQKREEKKAEGEVRAGGRGADRGQAEEKERGEGEVSPYASMTGRQLYFECRKEQLPAGDR